MKEIKKRQEDEKKKKERPGFNVKEFYLRLAIRQASRRFPTFTTVQICSVLLDVILFLVCLCFHITNSTTTRFLTNFSVFGRGAGGGSGLLRRACRKFEERKR